MATLAERVDEFKNTWTEEERVKYLTKLQKEDSRAYDHFRKTLVQESKARGVEREAIGTTVVEEELGAPVNKEEGASYGQRLDLSRTKDIYAQAEKLKVSLPEGSDVRVVPYHGEPTLFFRQQGEEEYKPANPEGMDWGDTAGIFSLETAAALGATALTRNAAPLLERAAVSGLATGLGRATDIGIEELRGYEHTTPGEAALDVGVSVLGAGAGEGVSRLLTGSANTVYGRGGKSALEEYEKEVQKIIGSDPKLKPMGFGQGPEGLPAIIRGRFSQFDPGLRTQEAEQGAGLGASLRDIPAISSLDDPATAPLINSLDDADLTRVMDSLKNQAERELRLVVGEAESNLSLDQAGKTIQRAVFDPKKESSFRVKAGAIEDKRWDAVREASKEYFYFDLQPALDAAEELTKKFMQPGKDDGVVEVSKRISPELQDVIKLLRSVKDGKVESQVRLITQQPGKILGPDGKPYMQSVDHGMQDGFEFIKTLRQEMHKFFGSDLELNEVNEAAARRLWGAVSESLNNPVGGGAAFKKALTRANHATTFKHETLDTNSMLRIARNENYGGVVDTILNGGTGFTQLQILKRVMPPERWDTLKGYLREDLIAHPENIPGVFKSGVGRDMKKAYLLFPTRAEQDALINFSKKIEQIDGSVFAKTMKRQTETSLRDYEMYKNASPAELRILMEGSGYEAKLNLRSAMTEGILRKAMRDQFGQITYDPASITKSIDAMLADPKEALKLKELLPPAAIQFLRDRKKVASWLAGRGFSKGGAGIAAGSTAEQMTDVSDPKGIVGAFIAARSISLISRMMNSPLALTYINNAVDPFGESRIVRTASVFAADLLAQQIPTDLQGEDE